MFYSMEMRFEKKTVTPRMAKAWLAKNTEKNRKPKKGKIPMYARDMAAGKWQLTGETIKFDEKGQLIDGQNRLLAVVEADVPVEFHVAYDVSPEAFAVLDSGAARTAADSLHITTSVAAIARWVIMWQHEDYMGGGAYKPTTAQIGELYLAEEKLLDAASWRSIDCQRLGLGTGSPCGMAHYLFSRIDEEMTHAFFDQYVSGADLPGRSPVLALRNKIARTKVDRLSRPEQLALFIRAWNNYRTDTPMDRMMITKSGALSNANFPLPK
jgi:hypothetical protein